jgi:broad specificity phosphatase PhoE
VRRLEVRRHAHTKKGEERGRGSHLSSDGVALARAVGAEIGPFDVVVASDVPRTLETALAMGFAVDDAIDVGIDDSFWSEVGKHEHWRWPDAFAGYRAAIASGGAVAKVGAAQREAWSTVLEKGPDGGAALFISHGHAIEVGLVTCLGDRKLDATGDAFGHCDGFRCSYENGSFDDFEILRAAP